MSKFNLLQKFQNASLLFEIQTKKTGFNVSHKQECFRLYNLKIKALKNLLKSFSNLKNDKDFKFIRVQGLDSIILNRFFDKRNFISSFKLYNFNSNNFYQIYNYLLSEN